MKKSLTKKTILFILLGLAAAGVIAYLVLNTLSARKAAVAELQTVEVTRGELVAIIGATGTVRANQSAVLVWQTSGRVGTIHVKTGEKVAGETILAELIESSLPQNIILAQADLVEAQRALDNLLDSNLSQARAQLNLANAKDAYERAVWSSWHGDTARTTNQNKIDAAQAAVTLARDRVNTAEENYDKVDERDDDDPLKANALSTLANARESLDKAIKDLDYLVQNPNEKEIAISEGKVAVALAEYEDAQREWERLKDGADPNDIAAAKARIAAIKATMALAHISAPFGGTVTEVNIMPGDLVTSGGVAFRLDDLSHLLVDVQVPEVDINRVVVGQPVELTFDAINNQVYQGKVNRVARVGTIESGLVNFKVTVEILNPDEQVLPGMTAGVNIIVSQLEDVLTVPNRAIRLVNNHPVVYILKNNIPTEVSITIGASSDSMSEILSGDLKEGDKVILNPPSSFMDVHFSGRPPF